MTDTVVPNSSPTSVSFLSHWLRLVAPVLLLTACTSAPSDGVAATSQTAMAAPRAEPIVATEQGGEASVDVASERNEGDGEGDGDGDGDGDGEGEGEGEGESAAVSTVRHDPADAVGARHYPIDYQVAFLPDSGSAEVTITLGRGTGHLSKLDFGMDASRYHDVAGDGDVSQSDGRVVWQPPKKGGSLHYRYDIEHARGNAFDARITKDWTLLRGDDLIPSARVRGSRDSFARATLHFTLPSGWSVETAWKPSHNGGYAIHNPDTRFDRPVGWILAGQLGVRREDVEGMSVSVAAPTDFSARRLDVLGAVNALGGEMLQTFGRLPPKLLIVLAPDPMWRGGLSGPRSLYLHADRPLISENGSSTLAHELSHVVSGIRGAEGDDWIAEGMAEYYSIELMSRVGLLSEDRRQRAIDWMSHHGRGIKTLHAHSSSGKRTARAVALFAELDREISERTDGVSGLDDLARRLVELDRRISLQDLREGVQQMTGESSQVLSTSLVN